jgi:hypothetical protein
MAEYTAGFELGVNGATIATSDPGDATAWTRIFGTHIYDNTHVAHGALAAKMDSTANFGLIWDQTYLTDFYGRFYLYATSNPSANTNVCSITGGGVTSRIFVQTDGTIVSTATGNVAGSVPIALNQWIRIEYHFIASATVGLLEIKLFNTKESSAPSETIAPTANRNTGASAPTELDHANGNAAAGWGGNIWFDTIVTNATSYPGPAVPDTGQNFAPVIYGRGAC